MLALLSASQLATTGCFGTVQGTICGGVVLWQDSRGETKLWRGARDVAFSVLSYDAGLNQSRVVKGITPVGLKNDGHAIGQQLDGFVCLNCLDQR